MATTPDKHAERWDRKWSRREEGGEKKKKFDNGQAKWVVRRMMRLQGRLEGQFRDTEGRVEGVSVARDGGGGVVVVVDDIIVVDVVSLLPFPTCLRGWSRLKVRW